VSRAQPLRLGTDAEFAAARAVLEGARYTEEEICRRLEIGGLHEFRWLRQGRIAGAELTDALDALIRLFLDEELLPVATAESLVGAEGLAALACVGLLARDAAKPGRCYGTVLLYQLSSLYLASDRTTSPDGSAFPPDAVYPAMREQARHFLESLPSIPCEALLDVGTGTGVAALAAAREYAGHAWGVDIAPRAVHFAEFNRQLNGIARATMLEGDLYAPVRGMTFDRIVAHPPSVPVFRPTFVFRDGGADGEQIVRGIVEGLPAVLRPGGRLYCFTMGSDRVGESFEQRIRRWMGPAGAEFDLALFATTTRSPDTVASPRAEENQYWKQFFDESRVTHLFFGIMVLQRHKGPRAGFTIRTQQGDRSGCAEAEWLLGWATAAADSRIFDLLLEARPRVSPHLQMRIAEQVRDGRSMPQNLVLETEYPFSSECHCPLWVESLLARCDGRSSSREHLAALRRECSLLADTSEADFAQILRALVSAGFLLIDAFPLPSA
jgi:SAM-dependent methyltransferase